MEWKDLATKINKAIINARRQGLEADTVLVGKKEKEAILRETADMSGQDFDEDFNPKNMNIWSIDIVGVNEESFFKVVYTIDID